MYVVLDTCVLLPALGDAGRLREVRERIVSKCDVVTVSKDTLKEYVGKAYTGGMSSYILKGKLQEINKAGKLKTIETSKLKLVKIEKKPNDETDVKFLVAAVAVRARCIITMDPQLLNLDPYECDQTQIRIFAPEVYLDLQYA